MCSQMCVRKRTRQSAFGFCPSLLILPRYGMDVCEVVPSQTRLCSELLIVLSTFHILGIDIAGLVWGFYTTEIRKVEDHMQVGKPHADQHEIC